MKNYSLFPKYIFRTPLLPLSQFIQEFNDTSSDTLLVKMQSFLEDPIVRQAIYIASPDLHKTYQNWLDGELTDKERLESLASSLLKYLSRMSSRCTPFGLFASVNMGSWGDRNETLLGDKVENYQYTRLDMQYLCQLKNELAADAEIKNVILFYPNSTLYEVGDELRYVEFNPAQTKQNYKISSVENSEYLSLILDTVEKNKGMKLTDIANLLVDDEITFEDAYEFIESLIDNQLLTSELEPNVIGDSYWSNLLKTFEKYAQNLPDSHKLVQVLMVLKKADSLLNNIGNESDKIAIYKAVQKELAVFETPIQEKFFLQVDAKGHVKESVLSFKIAGAIRKTMEMLYQVGRFSNNPNIETFKTDFQNKYEHQTVPLLEALDNEVGIGYAANRVGSGQVSPITEKVVTNPRQRKKDKEITWNKSQDLYLKLYMNALKNGDKEIIINEKDLEKADKEEWQKMTDSFYSMIQIVNAPDDDEPLIVFKFGGFGSAANILGRFTHLDPEIEKFTQSITQHEADINPEVVVASIGHLPKPRYGNFILRKQLYDYEIPFLTNSAVPEEYQIPLKDLWVSVKYNRIILWSKKLNKEVIPRLSTAHNFSAESVPVYHFLSDLQYQGKSGISNFKWGVLKSHFNFLPRVRYKNVVVHRATWQFKRDEFEHLLKGKKEEKIAKFKEWQQKWEIPSLVYLVEHDNELLLNLESPAFIQLFLREIKKRPIITVAECLFDVNSAIIKDELGHTYTNEFILSFGKKTPNQHFAFLSTPSNPKAEIQRTFSPGSEWLYYKIYMGEQSQNDLLLYQLTPLLEQLQIGGYIDKWFFIRYMDARSHLRVRLHLKNENAFHTIFTTFHQVLDHFIKTGIVWDVQLDTYKREIERYGTNSIELFEDLFYYDSVTTCQVLQNISEIEESSEFLMLYTLKSMDTYLSFFYNNLKDKQDFVKHIKNNFDHEFNSNKYTNKSINPLYKNLLSFIEQVEQNEEINALWMTIEDAIKERSTASKETIVQLQQLSEQNLLQNDIRYYLDSLLHMTINRIASLDPRKHELVFYHLLFRYYNMIASTNKVSFFDSTTMKKEDV